ncbi:ribokinase [Methylosoma difficile]
MLKVLVLGSYVRAHCLGLSALPAVGESLQAQSLWIEHGGKGLNLAVALHRLGVDVSLLAAVGQDASAEALLAYLQHEGIASEGLVRLPEPSGFGVGFIAADGSNCIAVYPGANALLSADHIQQAEALLSSAAAVYAQFEITDEPILAAFRQARQQSIRTVLNPSPWRIPSTEMLMLTDILIVNESEAAQLLGLGKTTKGISDWQQALPVCLEKIGWQGELFVVTLAEQGCVAWQQGAVSYQPAYPVTAVDATGAGDAFAAALLMALLEQKTLSDALLVANASGAYVAARQGVLQVLPTETQLAGFMGNSTAA